MKTENEINKEIERMLSSMEKHGRNVKRQRELSDLMDRLAEEEKTVEMTAKHRNLTPLWWAMGAAAACLLLWLLARPILRQHPEMEKEIIVDNTETVDSVRPEPNEAVFEEPQVELLAEETPVVIPKTKKLPQTTKVKKVESKADIIEQVVEQPALAEVMPTEPKDHTIIGSNTIPTANETPLTVQSTQRRVIRSLNLVCYECQQDPISDIKPVIEDKTFFGQPKDPNMKNGSLAYEIKLH